MSDIPALSNCYIYVTSTIFFNYHSSTNAWYFPHIRILTSFSYQRIYHFGWYFLHFRILFHITIFLFCFLTKEFVIFPAFSNSVKSWPLITKLPFRMPVLKGLKKARKPQRLPEPHYLRTQYRRQENSRKILERKWKQEKIAYFFFLSVCL